MNFRKEDAQLLELLRKHRGVIFGGYLRDIIAGKTPKDMDIVLWEEEEKGFLEGLKEIDNHLPLDIITEPYDPTLILGPSCDPDFDINLLAYDVAEDNLRFWVDVDMKVEDVVARILRGECLQFVECPPQREKKTHGYKVIGVFDVVILLKQEGFFISKTCYQPYQKKITVHKISEPWRTSYFLEISKLVNSYIPRVF